ncbi:hypothetical protein D3C72_482920 [compost metagenome]
MGVGQAAEQHRRVERLDQRDARRDRPDAVAGGQGVRYKQIGVGIGLAKFDAERILARWRLDPQGDHRVRCIDRLVEELVSNAEVDVANGWILGDGFFCGDSRRALIAAARLISRFAIHHGHVQVELPAIIEVVAARQVESPGVGLDPVEVDVAEKNRIQREEAVENQLARVIARIGDAGFDAELAAAEEATGLVVQVGNALRRLRIVRQRLPVRSATAPGGAS